VGTVEVHVGSIFADEVGGGELYLQVYVALPNRAGDDFVAHLITLALWRNQGPSIMTI
jgi:hypothetical protein